MNGDKNDDFQYRDGTIIMDTAEKNLTEREIFDFGQSCELLSFFLMLTV